MTCIVWSLRYLRSTFAALALLAQPVGSTALAWLVLDEAIGVEQGLGALAVGVGVVLCARAAAKE